MSDRLFEEKYEKIDEVVEQDNVTDRINGLIDLGSWIVKTCSPPQVDKLLSTQRWFHTEMHRLYCYWRAHIKRTLQNHDDLQEELEIVSEREKISPIVMGDQDFGIKKDEDQASGIVRLVRNATQKNRMVLQNARKKVEESKKKDGENDTVFHVGKTDRKILVNNRFLMHRPHVSSPQMIFFELIMENEGKTVRREELDNFHQNELESKSFSDLIGNIGFTGKLRKAFFSKSSKDEVKFMNPVTSNRLKEVGVSNDELTEELKEKAKTTVTECS